MNRPWMTGWLVIGVMACASLAVLGVDPPPPAATAIPAGTTLRVKLDTTLTDKTNKTGDAFTGEVSEPISVNGQEIVPKYSEVDGHIAFLKPSGRVAGKAQMRLVLDKIVTANNSVFPLNGSLEDAQGGVCAKTTNTGSTKADQEGTIVGCGKSKKKTLEAMGIAGGVGAGVGASIGMGNQMQCMYYGYCPPSSMGGDILHGAEIGAGTALVYMLFKHEKHIVLVQGSELTFQINRTALANVAGATPGTSADGSAATASNQ
ncbi:MAG TPA: hypothetical protein VMX16_19850 [Terriglobia bacterium]|nr:hypothetical protein [Terriglobia bacterium]